VAASLNPYKPLFIRKKIFELRGNDPVNNVNYIADLIILLKNLTCSGY
jgi:hypothetical protein